VSLKRHAGTYVGQYKDDNDLLRHPQQDCLCGPRFCVERLIFGRDCGFKIAFFFGGVVESGSSQLGR
jgi:hypothetical protein